MLTRQKERFNLTGVDIALLHATLRSLRWSW
jgi:hypothetical protein